MIRKSIEVHYLDGEIKPYKNVSLEDVTSEIFQDQRDPDCIILNDEITLQWNPSLFHYCFGHGRISEQELIEMTEIN